jgi:hypothetical protein
MPVFKTDVLPEVWFESTRAITHWNLIKSNALTTRPTKCHILVSRIVTERFKL